MDAELSKIVVICFTVIAVAGLLGASAVFATAFITAKPDEPVTVTKLISGGNGLRIVTVLSLIVGLIYLGLAGVLHGDVIAPIISGISGFVLGGWLTGKGDRQKKEQATEEAAEEVEEKKPEPDPAPAAVEKAVAKKVAAKKAPQKKTPAKKAAAKKVAAKKVAAKKAAAKKGARRAR